MKRHRTALQNGFLFSVIAGLFGGSIWTSIYVVYEIPDEALVAPRWIVIGGGILFCFLAGFLTGVFNAPKSATEPTLPAKARTLLVQRALDALGWFFYRLLVGTVVGIIATWAFSIVGITPWFALAHLSFDLDKIQLNTSEWWPLESGMISCHFCGFSGGVFGALLTTRRFPRHRPAVGSRAIRSSFLSYLLGLLFGASMGWLPREGDVFILVLFVASIPIGILSAILCSVWMDIRDMIGGRIGSESKIHSGIQRQDGNPP